MLRIRAIFLSGASDENNPERYRESLSPEYRSGSYLFSFEPDLVSRVYMESIPSPE